MLMFALAMMTIRFIGQALFQKARNKNNFLSFKPIEPYLFQSNKFVDVKFGFNVKVCDEGYVYRFNFSDA